MSTGPKYSVYDLRHLKAGSTVVVSLRGSAANVRLMTASQYQAYRNGRRHRYIGGLAKHSPVRLGVPRDDHYYATIDLMGLRGRTSSSVRVEPPPLPALRQASPERAGLSGIRHTLPLDEVQPDEAWDVFISHAGEDKDDVAQPLADALRERGVSVWLDKYTLRIGDSLRRRIDAGLSRSRFGVVILSPHFFAKPWPQYELDGIVTLSVDGLQTLLPIWHNMGRGEVMKHSPSLADKIARDTSKHSIELIAAEIAELVRPPATSE